MPASPTDDFRSKVGADDEDVSEPPLPESGAGNAVIGKGAGITDSGAAVGKGVGTTDSGAIIDVRAGGGGGFS